MPATQNRGIIQTVLGPVPPSELGPTTTHEHLYIDFSFMFRPAQDSPAPELADAPITLENVGWVRRNYHSNRSNLHLTDLDTTIKEVAMYRDAGGGAIVDATTIGIGRNPEALARISRESGVHVIMGAGFYVDAVHPEDMAQRSVADLAREISADITEGVAGSGIKAGIIGEMGCTWPLTVNERKTLSAAAIAQRETGAAVLIHPGRHPDAPRRNTGASGERRRGPHPGDHGTSGPDRVRVRRASAHRRVRVFTSNGTYSGMRDPTILSPRSTCPAMRSGWTSSGASPTRAMATGL